MGNSNEKHFIVISDKYGIPVSGTPITLDIKLMPQPTLKLAWFDNVAFVVAAIGLAGVLCTVFLGWWRMRKELSLALTLAKDAREYSKEQAQEDRNLAMEQANSERKHSADEAHRERIATARRIVYLDAAKEVVKANSYIGGLSSQAIGENDSNNAIDDLSAAISQITILGGMNTILKSREVQSLINLVYFKALGLTAPIKATKDKINIAISERDAAAVRASNIQEKFNDVTRGGAYPQEATELAEKSRILHAQAVEHANSVVSLHETYVQKQQEYIDFILNEFKEIQKVTDELIVMIRLELELPTDTAALFQSTLDMHAIAKRAVDDLRKSMDDF